MPIYEYECVAGHQYECAEGFDAPSEQKCPRCGGRSRRRISLPAVIFKGSGFYSTDNRKSSSLTGNGGSSDAPASPEKAGSSDGAGESKGEPKAEAKATE